MAVVLARDGLEIDVPFQDEGVPEGAAPEGSRRG